jgi:hypothetical protein
VRNVEERSQARATALAWFNSHRAIVVDRLGDDAVQEVDDGYRQLIDAAGRAASKRTYESALNDIRVGLNEIRLDVVVPPSTANPTTGDTPPDFSGLVADLAMQTVLSRRWSECTVCLGAGAPLAATVMMGGLLEGLLLAKVNSLSNKSSVFLARGAPKDRNGRSLPLGDWTLKHYLDVAHELGWISRSARDVGAVLRDYRNYVHPQKELSHGIALSGQDAIVWWEVSKSVARELL